MVTEDMLIHPDVLDELYRIKARHMLPVGIKIKNEVKGLQAIELEFEEEDRMLKRWMVDKACNEQLKLKSDD